MSSETSQLGLKRVFSETTDAATLELDSMSLNRFSRQNAALGAETTARLIKMKVCNQLYLSICVVIFWLATC